MEKVYFLQRDIAVGFNAKPQQTNKQLNKLKNLPWILKFNYLEVFNEILQRNLCKISLNIIVGYYRSKEADTLLN